MVPTFGELRFSVDDLAHALFTTGRAPADQFNFGELYVYEWLHRTTLVPAYLRRTYRGGLVRSDLAVTLERSESAALSYALGQAITGIFCRVQLGVGFLMHVERYARTYGLVFGASGHRPDFIGTSGRGWVVAEAKGRSSTVTSELRQRIRRQKRSVSMVEGQRPWLAVGCVACFPRRGGPMSVEVIDPEDEPEEPVALDVDRDLFVLAYYQPFMRALATSSAVVDDSYRTASFRDFRVAVRMPVVLWERLRVAEESRQITGLADELTSILDDVHGRELGLFPDGTGVEADWRSLVNREGDNQVEF